MKNNPPHTHAVTGRFCHAENITVSNITFIWLNTPAGTNATFRCPNTPSHSVTRRCMACMIWQDFDRQGCEVLDLSSLLEEIINSSVSVGQLLFQWIPLANKTTEACKVFRSFKPDRIALKNEDM